MKENTRMLKQYKKKIKNWKEEGYNVREIDYLINSLEKKYRQKSKNPRKKLLKNHKRKYIVAVISSIILLSLIFTLLFFVDTSDESYDSVKGIWTDFFEKSQIQTIWDDAYSWLELQDRNIKNQNDRPSFLSFENIKNYEQGVGGHPKVGKNVQEGISAGANFFTSINEKEAISTLIIQNLIEYSKQNNNHFPSDIENVLANYLQTSDIDNIIQWIEDPQSCPSNAEITMMHSNTPEYSDSEGWAINAIYHDIVDILELYDEETIIRVYQDVKDITGINIRYFGIDCTDKNNIDFMLYCADKAEMFLLEDKKYLIPDNDFTSTTYFINSTNNNELQEIDINEILDLLDLTEDRSQRYPYDDIKKTYKKQYFDSMLYRIFIGINQTNHDGNESDSNYQLPCSNMKHFYAQYISPYPETACRQGVSSVVIAKYYEGAEISGTVNLNGDQKDLQIVCQQNIIHYGSEIPVNHDTNISVNGSFVVLVPAGEVNLQIRRYPELGQNAFVMLNVTFGEDGMYPAITEEEATRSADDYQRQVDIEIPTASLEGYIYDNLDDSEGVFNESSDDPLVDTTIQLYGIDALDPNQGTPTAYDWNNINELTTDENGHYNTSSLLPGYYQIVVIDKDGFQLENNIIPVNVGENWHNVTRPQDGNIEGKVYFDENDNEAFDAGEEISGASIEVVYTSTGTNEVVETITTDANGQFESSYLLPGAYKLIVSYLPDYYESSTDITIAEDEKNQVFISLNTVDLGGK